MDILSHALLSCTLMFDRINTYGHAKRSESHPDSRAIMFENDTYSKRKIESFLNLLSGFHTALIVVDMFKQADIRLVLNLCNR